MTIKLDNVSLSIRDGFTNDGRKYDWVKVVVIAKDEELRCGPGVDISVPILADDARTKGEIRSDAYAYARELLGVALAALDADAAPVEAAKGKPLGSGLAAPQVISNDDP